MKRNNYEEDWFVSAGGYGSKLSPGARYWGSLTQVQKNELENVEYFHTMPIIMSILGRRVIFRLINIK